MKITITTDEGIVLTQIDPSNYDGENYSGDIQSIISIVTDEIKCAFAQEERS